MQLATNLLARLPQPTSSFKNCCLFNCSKRLKKLSVLLDDISYKICNTSFLQLISECGYDGEKFSLHSNKRGGATHAANRVGMEDTEISEVGNWSYVKTARLYIDKHTHLRLKKSLALQKSI